MLYTKPGQPFSSLVPNGRLKNIEQAIPNFYFILFPQQLLLRCDYLWPHLARGPEVAQACFTLSRNRI